MEIDTKQLRLAALAYETGQSLAKTLICIADYIDQLKLELEKAREYGKRVSESVVAANRAYDNEFNRAEDLECQLSEARAEVDYIKQVAFPKRIEKLRSEARQDAARECSIIVHNLGCTYSLDSLKRILLVDAADLISRKFKLEGEG